MQSQAKFQNDVFTAHKTQDLTWSWQNSAKFCRTGSAKSRHSGKSTSVKLVYWRKTCQ